MRTEHDLTESRLKLSNGTDKVTGLLEKISRCASSVQRSFVSLFEFFWFCRLSYIGSTYPIGVLSIYWNFLKVKICWRCITYMYACPYSFQFVTSLDDGSQAV